MLHKTLRGVTLAALLALGALAFALPTVHVAAQDDNSEINDVDQTGCHLDVGIAVTDEGTYAVQLRNGDQVIDTRYFTGEDQGFTARFDVDFPADESGFGIYLVQQGTGTVNSIRKYNNVPEGCFAGDFVGTFPSDARINPQPYAPVAIYCEAAGFISIWQIDPVTGRGARLVQIPFGDIPATPTTSSAPIAERSGMQFFRLTSGEFEVVAPMPDGKYYIAIWDRCPPTYLQVLTMENGVSTPAERLTF